MRRFTGISLVLALCALFAAPQTATAQSLGDINWRPLDAGIQEAAQQKKHVFVFVYTDWCGYCRKMEGSTLTEKPVIQELAKKFVSVKFNAEDPGTIKWQGKDVSHQDLTMMLGIQGFPTLLFLNPKGEVIGRLSSYADSKLMVDLLAYISTGARERNISFDEFLSQKR